MDNYSIDFLLNIEEVNKIVSIFQNEKAEIRLVGGCVRNALLNKNYKDIDCAVNIHPNDTTKILQKNNIKFQDFAKKYGSVSAFINDKKIEITSLRKDIAQKGRHTDVLYTEDWKIDAYRRDFTINSLYYDIETKKIHDYVGGIKDLETKTLKAIKNPDICFREDSVRMLRAVKFESKLPVELPTDHKKSIVKNAYYLLEASPSRLFDDVIKIMHCGNSIEGFQKLKEYNLFKYLFPRINSLIKNNQKYDSMIVSALKNTDKRFNEGLSLNPAFIYAVILWPLFEEKSKTNKKTYLFEEFEKILFEQSKNISIPNFFQPTIFQIWRMQDKFFDLSRKNIEYMVRQEKFRAAFDFFLIRSNVDSDLLEYSNNWQDVYDNLK